MAASDRAAEDECTLFVKNLPDGCDRDMLREAFPEAVKIRVPMHDDRPRGFGFLVFGSPEEAENVLTNSQGVDLYGSALLLDYNGSKSSFKSNSRRGGGGGGYGGGGASYGGGDRGSDRGSAGRGTSKTLFCKNLPYETCDDDLMEAFQGCVSARVVMDREMQRSKGFGFIDYDSPEAAAEAFDAMKYHEFGGRKVFLDFETRGGGGGGGGFGRGGRGGGGRGGYRGNDGYSGGGYRGGRGGGYRY